MPTGTRERRKPTHILTVEVPLWIVGEHDFDPVRDAVVSVLSLTHAAYVGAICDDPQVSLREPTVT